MDLRLIEDDKQAYLDLLLLADPEPRMIERYLGRGRLHALYEGERLVAVAVVTAEGEGLCELKNLAVEPASQGRGYGRRLIESLCALYAADFQVMQVGTAAAGVGYYLGCGFYISHQDPGFFVKHYDGPLFDHGIQCVDMIYLRRELA